jgi:hypothetical protein
MKEEHSSASYFLRAVVYHGVIDPKITLFTDEDWFYFSVGSYISSQNNRQSNCIKCPFAIRRLVYRVQLITAT